MVQLKFAMILDVGEVSCSGLGLGFRLKHMLNSGRYHCNDWLYWLLTCVYIYIHMNTRACICVYTYICMCVTAALQGLLIAGHGTCLGI